MPWRCGDIGLTPRVKEDGLDSRGLRGPAVGRKGLIRETRTSGVRGRPHVMPQRNALSPGDVIGERFELVGEIGEGGMGRVYEAVDRLHGRAAAVKVLGRKLAGDPEFRRRFERESAAAERANHPHVLPVWDRGEHDGAPYLATPLCDLDLGTLVYEQRGRLDAEHALRILAQIAWALDWAHERGIVHRDVKPENILLVTGPADDHAYLADFGMSKVTTDYTLTQLGQAAGFSPAYAAPEQWLGEPVSAATDLYALAASLYACLTGRPPFAHLRGSDLRDAHLNALPPAIDPGLDPAAARLSAPLLRALAKAPEDRYPSCGEFVLAAREALRQPPAPMPSETPATSPSDVSTPFSLTVSEEPAVSGSREAEETDAERATVAGVRSLPRDAAVRNAETARSHGPTSPPPPAVPTDPGPPERGSPGGLTQPDPGPRASRPGRLRLLLAGVVVCATIGVVLLLALRSSKPPGPPVPKPSAVPVTRVKHVPVGRRPVAMTAGAGSLWSASQVTGTLTRVDAGAGNVTARSIPAVGDPLRAVIHNGVLWVLSGDGRLARISPSRGSANGPPIDLGLVAPVDLAAGFSALWVASRDGVLRVPLDGQRALGAGSRALVEADPQTTAVVAGARGVWSASSATGRLTRFDGASGRRVARVPVIAGVRHLVAVDGAIWMLAPSSGTVARVDERTGAMNVTRHVSPAREAALAAGRGSVFVISGETGAVTRLNANTGRPIPFRASVGAGAADGLVAGGALWIANPDRDRLSRVSLSGDDR
jgi:serine/threonine protein kinase/streptogramin lyase